MAFCKNAHPVLQDMEDLFVKYLRLAEDTEYVVTESDIKAFMAISLTMERFIHREIKTFLKDEDIKVVKVHDFHQGPEDKQ